MRRRRGNAWLGWLVASVVGAAGCGEPVERPSGATLLDVGTHWLLLLERDTLGVEYVTVYPFARGGGAGG